MTAALTSFLVQGICTCLPLILGWALFVRTVDQS